MTTISDVLARLPSPDVPRLPAPPYTGTSSRGVVLGTESVRYHTSDENWQAILGLAHAGYVLAGYGLAIHETDVLAILGQLPGLGVVLVSDRREWLGLTAERKRDPRMQFRNVSALRDRPDLFRLTVVKDAHADHALHRESAEEGAYHAWIACYAPRIVARLLPFVRPEHLVRTYHSVDADAVPCFSPEGRRGCLLSGAVSGAYPLRSRLIKEVRFLPDTDYLKHPGYHERGTCTPAFLQTLSRYKVAICTASMYGYALRKLIEGTAAGCRIITDLPEDDVLPEIDGNLVRVDPATPTREIGELIRHLCNIYDPERQEHYATKAKRWYDYRAVGRRLADDVELLRRSYNARVAP